MRDEFYETLRLTSSISLLICSPQTISLPDANQTMWDVQGGKVCLFVENWTASWLCFQLFGSIVRVGSIMCKSRLLRLCQSTMLLLGSLLVLELSLGAIVFYQRIWPPLIIIVSIGSLGGGYSISQCDDWKTCTGFELSVEKAGFDYDPLPLSVTNCP